MAKYPYYCFFPGDFAAKTHHLSTFEKGVYRQLLDCAWNTDNCELPVDDGLLARFAGIRPAQWKKMKPLIMPFWDVAGEVMTNERLLAERTRCELWRARGSKGGKRSAEVKALKNNDMASTQVENRCNLTPTRSQLPTPTPTPTKKESKSATNELAASPSRGSTVCGNDWEPDTNTIAGLLKSCTMVEINKSVDEMRDWSKAGRKLKHDWNATLRNWMRRNKTNGTHPSQNYVSPASIRKAERDAAIAETRKDCAEWQTTAQGLPGSPRLNSPQQLVPPRKPKMI